MTLDNITPEAITSPRTPSHVLNAWSPTGAPNYTLDAILVLEAIENPIISGSTNRPTISDILLAHAALDPRNHTAILDHYQAGKANEYLRATYGAIGADQLSGIANQVQCAIAAAFAPITTSQKKSELVNRLNPATPNPVAAGGSPSSTP